MALISERMEFPGLLLFSCFGNALFGLVGYQCQSYLPERMFLLHECGEVIWLEASFERN